MSKPTRIDARARPASRAAAPPTFAKLAPVRAIASSLAACPFIRLHRRRCSLEQQERRRRRRYNLRLPPPHRALRPPRPRPSPERPRRVLVCSALVWSPRVQRSPATARVWARLPRHPSAAATCDRKHVRFRVGECIDMATALVPHRPDGRSPPTLPRAAFEALSPRTGRGGVGGFFCVWVGRRAPRYCLKGTYVQSTIKNERTKLRFSVQMHAGAVALRAGRRDAQPRGRDGARNGA